MSRFQPRRPSAGLIVATTALVIAMGGVGYAAGGSDSKSDKKTANKAAKSYFKSHIAGASVLHSSSSDTASNASALGGAPPTAYQSKILTAVVTNNGSTCTVVRGSSGVTASRPFTGECFVHMGRDVSACTWIATQGNPGSTNVPADFATVRGDSTSVNDVFVVTRDSSGANADANFHLAVIC